MKFWELSLILLIVTSGVHLWALLGWTSYYQKWLWSDSRTVSNVKDVLEYTYTISGAILTTTWPITPILFLLSSRIDPIPWLS